jgi:hypothetical protein
VPCINTKYHKKVEINRKPSRDNSFGFFKLRVGDTGVEPVTSGM